VFPLSYSDYQRLLIDGVHNVTGLPFYPLDSPGMPLPGPDFVEHALALGDPDGMTGKGREQRLAEMGPQLSLLYFQALYNPQFVFPIPVGNERIPCRFQCGHLAGNMEADGPRPARVMIIGKNPGREEEAQQRNFVSPTSQHLWRVCELLGIPQEEIQDWYLTNLMRFNNPDTTGKKAPNTWIRDCLPLLHEELRIVRPKYILCLGADSCKELTGLSLSAMRGRVEPLLYPIHKTGERPEYCEARVMAAIHPSQVHHTPELIDELKSGVSLFWRLVQGADIGGAETGLDHRILDNEADLAAVVDMIVGDNNPASRILSIDCEWQGEREIDPGSYLRTVQFSHKPKCAYLVKLRHAGGAPAFFPDEAAATRQLKRLFLHPGTRLGGHFFRADLPWLLTKLDLDLREAYAPAETPELTATEGGWDLNLMENAVCETGMLGLEVLRSKYTGAPPYETKLTRWKKKYCAERGIKESDLEGFGDWDDDDFFEYALYDADIPRRIFDTLNKLLDKDQFGNNCRHSYWLTHRASLAVLEMEQTGLCLDEARVESLAAEYVSIRNELLEYLRGLINWPTFNPGSVPQCQAMLFGDQYTRKPSPPGWPDVRPRNDQTLDEARKEVVDAIKAAKQAESLAQGDANLGRLATHSSTPAMPTVVLGGEQPHWTYILPEGAICQNLTPLMSTGDGKPWERLVAKGESHKYSPSTNSRSLGILGWHNKPAFVLRDIKFISKALSTVLRRPNQDSATGEYETDENGDFVYEKGMLASKSSDGKIHTRIKQTMETGRSSSSKYALQNISKRREDDFAKIFGQWDKKEDKYRGSYQNLFPEPRYKHPQRSVFVAAPGCVLMEADYSGAEIAGLMWMAGDPQGIEDVRRNNLPEDHPEYFDIHSNMAVRAFKLNCEPNKKALKAIGKSGLRVGAKAVVFGAPYQRGAADLAMQCREEGADTTEADAQALLDYYFERYSYAGPFLDSCKLRTYDPGWMAGFMGRHRRFHWTDDDGVAAAQEREACNWPIQNLVADAVWSALRNMWDFRDRNRPDGFQFLLQIHDAILLQVPFAHVPWVYREVFPRCMIDEVPIWPCDLDGRRRNLPKPYHLAISREVMFRWGESESELEELLGIGTPDADQRAIKLMESKAAAV